MKILTYVIAIFLIFGMLGAPSSVFAQESGPTGSDSTSHYDASTFLGNNFIPLLKGGGRGGSSGSSKVHHADVDDVSDAASGDSSGDDGSGWIITVIILIIIIAIIAIAVWYFFLRK